MDHERFPSGFKASPRDEARALEELLLGRKAESGSRVSLNDKMANSGEALSVILDRILLLLGGIQMARAIVTDKQKRREQTSSKRRRGILQPSVSPDDKPIDQLLSEAKFWNPDELRPDIKNVRKESGEDEDDEEEDDSLPRGRDGLRLPRRPVSRIVSVRRMKYKQREEFLCEAHRPSTAEEEGKWWLMKKKANATIRASQRKDKGREMLNSMLEHEFSHSSKPIPSRRQRLMARASRRGSSPKREVEPRKFLSAAERAEMVEEELRRLDERKISSQRFHNVGNVSPTLSKSALLNRANVSPVSRANRR